MRLSGNCCVWATVEVCPNCRDEWIDETEHDQLVRLFKRKTFNLGGSVAVGIPKELAGALSIGSGTSVDFAIRDGKIVISNVWGARVGVSENRHCRFRFRA